MIIQQQENHANLGCRCRLHKSMRERKSERDSVGSEATEPATVGWRSGEGPIINDSPCFVHRTSTQAQS